MNFQQVYEKSLLFWIPLLYATILTFHLIIIVRISSVPTVAHFDFFILCSGRIFYKYFVESFFHISLKFPLCHFQLPLNFKRNLWCIIYMRRLLRHPAFCCEYSNICSCFALHVKFFKISMSETWWLQGFKVVAHRLKRLLR